ncbi:MAG: hypothetical protein V3U78_00575 [Thiotrichaceae bacterium]
MSRFLRIVIFALLIAAIVFFGFRASQPMEKVSSADSSTIDTPAIDTPAIDTTIVETQTEEIISPDLKNLSVNESIDESDKKEKNVSETEKDLETQKKEVEIDIPSKEKDK